MMVLLGEMIMAGAEGGGGLGGCTQSRGSIWPWNLPLSTPSPDIAQDTGRVVAALLGSQKGDTQHQGFQGLRATSPAAMLLLTVRGNSTLTAFISKISCSSSSPSHFCKEDICFCFSCPERNNSGSWRVTEQHPRQAIIFCPSYLL